MNRSDYAEKQGRAPSRPGAPPSGRTRYAPTSPLSADYKPNPNHRLALYYARGEELERRLVRQGRHFTQTGADRLNLAPQP